MPFRIDIIAPNAEGYHFAPTQSYQNHLDLISKYGEENVGDFHGEKYTKVNLFLVVARESVSWFVNLTVDSDYTSQKWRNEFYDTAAKAHRCIDSGCVGYYRGTNSLHVKRQHIVIEEAAHNHNHYRFDSEVTPALFAEHIRNFVNFDSLSTYDGTSKVGEAKFLDSDQAEDIIAKFEDCYIKYHRVVGGSSESWRDQFLSNKYRKYTSKDQFELTEGLIKEGRCRDMSKGMAYTMTGIDAHLADTRQHSATSKHVKECRSIYQSRCSALSQRLKETIRTCETMPCADTETSTSTPSL